MAEPYVWTRFEDYFAPGSYDAKQVAIGRQIERKLKAATRGGKMKIWREIIKKILSDPHNKLLVPASDQKKRRDLIGLLTDWFK